MPTDWKAAQEKAASTAKWAVTMTKVRIRRVIAKTKWQLVTFLGPQGSESVGIVDLLAIRKNHAPGKSGLKRGDLFEVVLIQVKGGSAPFPSADELQRLRIVGKAYSAKAVLLAQWKKGEEASFYSLTSISSEVVGKDAWTHLSSPAEVFR